MNAELSKRLRLLASAVSVLVLLLIIAVAWGYTRVRASLPQLDGTATIAGLSGEVAVERDALGVPTLTGANRIDVARALGFVHGQDRFFQMDVWRRVAAGELAEVFGIITLRNDRKMRQHGFRRLAQRTLETLPPDQRALLDAYAEGVNAGIAALGARSFEYYMVRATPQPWKPEDTLLVSDAMLTDLQDGVGRYDRTLSTVLDQLGQQGLGFFAPLQTPRDAALDGSVAPLPAIPGPGVINLRQKTSAHFEADASNRIVAHAAGARESADPFGFVRRGEDDIPGSNAFALAGAHTASGAGLLASDMHLGLNIPNVWYRASLKYSGRTITGVTLPGVPLVIAGSNGQVAWSFTNSYADTGDIVTFDANPIAPSLYRAPGHDDLLQIERRREIIRVKGHKPEEREYEWTIWGPVVGRNDKGHVFVYRWVGHDAEATNLALWHMEEAVDVASAVDVAHRAGMPTQNIVIADAKGDIAWTIAGRLPRRVGFSGRLPVSFQFGDRSWNGTLPPADIPVATTKPLGGSVEMALPEGRIWSANQRMMGGKALEALGDGGYARPGRAAQIREDLSRLERATPKDLLAIQLDDRAVFLERWHKLLLDTLSPAALEHKELLTKLRSYVEKWEGRASVDAVTYPVVKIFRTHVYARVFGPIFKSCREANPDLSLNNLLLEGPVWSILESRPEHLLDPQYANWDALLLAAIDDTIKELNQGGVRLPYATWGQRNVAQIRHPFSYMLPWFFRSTLDMAKTPLPGDIDMPRVQTPTHGASERFVVSPGRENEGIFHMPGGQSGHPLSPYYRAGHQAWERGDATPFLPGKAEHKLVLQPAAGAGTAK